MVNGKSSQERPVIRFSLHVCLAKDLKKLYAGADFRSDIKQATFPQLSSYIVFCPPNECAPVGAKCTTGEIFTPSL